MSGEELQRRLLETFRAELAEQVGAMGATLLELEARPDDHELVRLLFRSAHTVKGAARVAGVSAIEHLCQALESFLAEVRDGGRQLQETDFSLLFAAVDAMGGARAQLDSGAGVAVDAFDPLVHALESQAAAPSPERTARAPRTQAAQPEPAGDPSAADQAGPERAASTAPAPALAPAPAPAAAESVRVPAERLDALIAATTELLAASATVQGNALAWSREARHLTRVSAQADEAELQQSVRTALRLSQEARGAAHRLGRVTAELGQLVRLSRVRPLGEAMQALPRAARDVAATLGKEVELVLEGTELEADRAVVDALREPLLHLVRNAVDHGIERPEDRRASGKPVRGRITVAASLQRDRLVVRVTDDGSGIDEQALRRRLRDAGRPVPSSRRELAMLLLAGGISRLDRASEISGRGVGLDLARAAVERIGGSIDVRWTPARGTTVILEAPPAPMLLRALLVEAGGEPLAIPVGYVERVLRIRADSIQQVEGVPVVVRDGRPVPVASLAVLLGPPLPPPPAQDMLELVLVSTAEEQVALRIDALLSEQEVVIRPLPLTHGAPPHVAGAAVLASGAVALLLNPVSIVSAGLPDQALHAAGPTGAAPRRARILIVDDSITTRTLEQSVLEAAGFETRTAVDGEDAWTLLVEESFDAVVADVEMPRLDGLGLCIRMRASRQHAGTPVVLVTGRESVQDRERGMEAGADAYITKSSFDQTMLIDTLNQLVG